MTTMKNIIYCNKSANFEIIYFARKETETFKDIVTNRYPSLEDKLSKTISTFFLK